MSQATPADLASLAEELAEGVGVGHISEATAERLQSALPAVSFLRYDLGCYAAFLAAKICRKVESGSLGQCAAATWRQMQRAPCWRALETSC